MRTLLIIVATIILVSAILGLAGAIVLGSARKPITSGIETVFVITVKVYWDPIDNAPDVHIISIKPPELPKIQALSLEQFKDKKVTVVIEWYLRKWDPTERVFVSTPYYGKEEIEAFVGDIVDVKIEIGKRLTTGVYSLLVFASLKEYTNAIDMYALTFEVK